MAKKRVGKFPKAFRQMAVARLNQCENIVTLAKELGVSRRLLCTWREKLEPTVSGAGPPVNAREATLRNEVRQLNRVLAEKVLEVDCFQRCLAQRRGDVSGAPSPRDAGEPQRVGRLMREDNLLAVQPRAFVVTTDAQQQRRGEKHHALNHQVCSFLWLTGGIHPSGQRFKVVRGFSKETARLLENEAQHLAGTAGGR